MSKHKRLRPWRPKRELSAADRYAIFEWATEGNSPLHVIADAYDSTEAEIEQIVLSFIPPKAD